jgi:ABC-type glycerol-3-phosphate transport system substrate-binding protein
LIKVNILNYYRKFIEKSRSFCTGVVRKLQLYFHRFIEKSKSLCTGLIRKLQLCFYRFIEKAKPLCAGVVRKLQLYYRKFIEKSRTFCTGLIQKLQSLGKAFIQRIYIPSLQGWLVDIFLFTVAAALLVFFFVSRMHKAASEPERVSISISSQCGDLFGRDIVNALIQEFEEQNPDLRIQEITQEAEGDDGGADIVFFDDSGFSSLMNALALASLAPYNYTGTQAGQWALPLVSFMDIFIYNIDILQAANLDRPPKTRAEFLAAAKAVVENNPAPPEQEPVFAFALGLSPADPAALRRDFYPWVWINGGEIRLGSAEPALPRTVTDAIAFLGRLNSEELLAPGTFEKTGAQRLREFAEGKIAMLTASARDIPFLRNNAHGITLGITALPAVTQGKTRVGLSSIYAGMSSDCALPDEAWKFLAFFAGKRHVLSETLGAVPGSFPDVFAGEYIAEDPLCSKAWDIFEAADIVEYEPNQPFEEEINRLIREKLVDAFQIEASE